MESGFDTYMNSGYSNKRENKQSLIVKDDAPGKTFNLQLAEPLTIDSLSDVYLDSFTTYNIGTGHKSTEDHKQFFLLDIDQFDLRSVSTNAKMNRKIIIPNEEATGGATLKVHKGKKMNYVSSINPKKITNISGSITDTNGDSILQDTTLTIDNAGASENGQTLTFKNDKGFSKTITADTSITDAAPFSDGHSFRVNSSGTAVNNAAAGIENILNNLLNTSLGITATRSNNVLTLTGTGGNPVTGTYITNNDATLNSPHFIAEFLIVNRK
tara:strand:- start:1656 stop:2465 length:810 start_codon:yes stop_codon:yes gene_type:complete